MGEKTKTNNMDDAIIKLFAKVKAKKEELAKCETPIYVTGGLFRYTERVAEVIDLRSIRDERKLVEILIFLKERSKNFNDCSEELGIENRTFSWLGFSYDEWLSDLKMRANIINISKRKTELQNLEARLNAIVSPEQRRMMELSELEAALAD